jgi:hypothetical protein
MYNNMKPIFYKVKDATFISYLRYIIVSVSFGIPVSSTNKTDLHNIAEILLKVALNTMTLICLNLMFVTDC